MATTSRAEMTPYVSVSTVASVSPNPRGGISGRLWRARGFFGGIVAICLAWLGQQALLNNNDYVSAQRYYGAAMVLMIISLTYPTLKLRRGRSDTVSQVDSNVLPTRPVGSVRPPTGQEFDERRSDVAAQEDALKADQLSSKNLIAGWKWSTWTRWKALRARLGLRMTLAGLALVISLAVASAVILLGDIGSEPGGWLWAASLATLLLTFLGLQAQFREASLLPTPASDFFARGLPSIPLRWEALLASVMMLIALALRINNLEYHPGIFGDEGEQGMDVRAIVEGRPTPIFGSGWWLVPNLSFYVWSFTLRLFGDSMFGLRMFSALSGLASVWFIYKIGRLLWGQRAGLIAGTMLAISPLALQFSRFANVSSATAALWVIGFYFLFMALRYRRWSDWILAGFFWSLNLYFYPSGKLIIPLAGAIGLYCLIRWRIQFFKQYALGFVLLGFTAVLTFLPYAIFSQTAEVPKWNSFAGRAGETSIFSPQNQGPAFVRYGIPYVSPNFGESLPSQFLANPGGWTRLIAEQLRVTTEVLYRSGDPTPFFQIQENGGALLAPFWAVLAILGLAYGLWKFWDARFGIASLWFWGGLMGTALTMDTPSVQRMAGAWPVLMIFPAVLLDRVFAAGWPLSKRLARGWSLVPLAALLIFFAADSRRLYFEHYMATCPFCDATTQARYAQSLGSEYKAYQMGVGNYDIFFSYGSTRFVAKGVEGVDMTVPADFLPVTDEGKGAAFIVIANNAAYMSLLREFYPMGVEESIRSADGAERFKSFKVTSTQLAATRRVEAIFTLPDGTLLMRLLSRFGMVDEASGRWAVSHGASFPAEVTWRAAVVAPSYGVYTLALKGGAGARLEIDGRLVAQGANSADVVLAKGMHDVRVTGLVAAPGGAGIELLWASPGSPPQPIASRFVYNGSTGGLSGEFAPMSRIEDVDAADPLGEASRFTRRSDAFFGFKETTDSVGQRAFIARWQGTLDVPREGEYNFSIVSNGASTLLIDGKSVVVNTSSGAPGPAVGQVTLTRGAHPIDLRYAWMHGRATLEMFWTPPGGENVLIPPQALRPLERSWPAAEVPDAPPAQIPDSRGAAAIIKAEPVQVIGGLSNPRGIAVDGQGNVYVGDRGNGRVVVFGPDGRELRRWGQAAPPERAQNPNPGEFSDISDVAVGSDGTVYVMDYGANRLQLYTRDGELKLTLGNDLLGAGSPNGIAASPTGELYIASTAQSRVIVFANPASLTEETRAALPNMTRSVTGGDGANRIEQPLDAVVDPTDTSRLYVADLRDRIALIDRQGAVIREWPIPTGREDGGGRLAIAPDGKILYLSDPDRHRVASINLADGLITYMGGLGSANGQMTAPSGVAVGPDGRLYVLDRGNGRVQVFNP